MPSNLALKKPVYDWSDLIPEICQVIGSLTGNMMAEKQLPMVESRMKRRCLDLKMETPSDYKAYWKSHYDEENKYLIGLLTTHFTSFFREFSHFEWLAQDLPRLISVAKSEGRKTIRIWSAASSKGQEVWSLCMWLDLHMPKIDPSMDWKIMGSDIDASSVKEAMNGVYHRRELETAPRHLWEGKWVKGKGEIADWYKIKPELKARASFQCMNLLSLTLPANEKFDVIICRNVLIYFDRENQTKVAQSLMNHLQPQGVLITGMSESLSSHGLKLKSMAPSIYVPQGVVSATLSKTEKVEAAPKTLTLPKPMRILCVDDSSTVITILKRILTAPDFEIVGVATNGQEAIEKWKSLKPDAITLDLHMPIMDGPTFLKESNAAKTTPVVVVSSVGRDDNSMVGPLFERGVSDFVEKPTLENMSKIAEELSQKLKMGWMTKNKNMVVTSTPSAESTRSSRPNGHIIFNFGPKDEDQLIQTLKQQDWKGDELTFVGDLSSSNLLSLELKIKIYTKNAKKTRFITRADSSLTSSLPCLWLHFKEGSETGVKIYRNKKDFLVVEETVSKSLQESANDVSPITSFSYLVTKFLKGN